MKKKGQRIFFKIFTYTVLFVLLICLTAVLLFWRQFLSFYRREQVRQLSESFQPIITTITEKGRTPEEMEIYARAFADSNQSFRFQILGKDGNVLFTTVGSTDGELPSYKQIAIRTTTVISDQIPSGKIPIGQIPIESSGDAKNSFVFTGYGPQIDYDALVLRSLLGVSIMLAIAVLGAFIFARKITKPLEDEIIRERTIEENQRLFFSAASHELKTPIAAARALVESMIAGVGDYKDHPRYLRECLRTLDSQAHLVSEILEIVKLSDANAGTASGGLADTESQATSLDLADLGRTVLAEYRPMAEQRGLLIQGDFPSVSIKANRNLLQRVLSNVIANAVQNTPEGGTIRIESVEGKNLRLSITNTEARIPEEGISRLFEPFYRLDTARTRHGTQSGLGLVIVKKALDRMGFPFALENSSEGVVFWVEMAIKKP
jgi:two-component system, OmpR family, sensor histidine kinase VanS